jgi:hypothetical protein
MNHSFAALTVALLALCTSLPHYAQAQDSGLKHYAGSASKKFKVDADKLTRPKTLEEAEAQIYALTEARIIDKITSNIVCDAAKKKLIHEYLKEYNLNHPTNPSNANASDAKGGKEATSGGSRKDDSKDNAKKLDRAAN